MDAACSPPPAASRSRARPRRPPTRASATSIRASTATASRCPTSAPAWRAARAFEAVTTRPDGGAVAGGSIFTGAASEGVVAQLTPSGALDAGFGTGGVRRIFDLDALTQIHDVALDGTGQVLAAGGVPARRRRRRSRPRSSGSPRTAPPAQLFPIGGTGEAHAVAPHGGGTLVAGWRDVGTSGQDVFMLARLTAAVSSTRRSAAATASSRPASRASASSQAAAMAVAPSGDIVLAGFAFANAGVPAVARFNATGTSVQTFLPADHEPERADRRHAERRAGGRRGPDHGGRRLRRVRDDAAPARRRLARSRLRHGRGRRSARSTSRRTSRALALDGDRAFVAGSAGPGAARSSCCSASLDGAGVPDARLGGAPPGWRTFPIAHAEQRVRRRARPGRHGVHRRRARHAGPARSSPATSPNAAPVRRAQRRRDGDHAGAPVTFDAGGSSDPEGEALRYAFDLDGDGSYEFDGGANPFAADAASPRPARTPSACA